MGNFKGKLFVNLNVTEKATGQIFCQSSYQEKGKLDEVLPFLMSELHDRLEFINQNNVRLLEKGQGMRRIIFKETEEKMINNEKSP